MPFSKNLPSTWAHLKLISINGPESYGLWRYGNIYRTQPAATEKSRTRLLTPDITFISKKALCVNSAQQWSFLCDVQYIINLRLNTVGYKRQCDLKQCKNVKENNNIERIRSISDSTLLIIKFVTLIMLKGQLFKCIFTYSLKYFDSTIFLNAFPNE